MPDYTSYGGPVASPTADPNGVAFTTLDTLSRRGVPGMVLAVVQPTRVVEVANGNGDVCVLQGITYGVNASAAGPVTSADTVWLRVREATELRRDGAVTF